MLFVFLYALDRVTKLAAVSFCFVSRDCVLRFTRPLGFLTLPLRSPASRMFNYLFICQTKEITIQQTMQKCSWKTGKVTRLSCTQTIRRISRALWELAAVKLTWDRSFLLRGRATRDQLSCIVSCVVTPEFYLPRKTKIERSQYPNQPERLKSVKKIASSQTKDQYFLKHPTSFSPALSGPACSSPEKRRGRGLQHRTAAGYSQSNLLPKRWREPFHLLTGSSGFLTMYVNSEFHLKELRTTMYGLGVD